MGPGKTTLLLKAVDAVELEDNRDGITHVGQARLARKALVKLRDQGFLKYTVVLPSLHHNKEMFYPWDRSRPAAAGPQDSEHSYCGYHTRDDVLWSSSSHRAQADQGNKSN